jgi:hypothetical protein
VTDQPTPVAVAVDLIRAAIADAVTINAGPLIDHAASGVLYALGMLNVPPADGAPGPLGRVTDHTHTGPTHRCDTARFGETCGQPATEHQLRDEPTCGAIGSLNGPLPGHTGRCYRQPHDSGHHRDQNGHEWDGDAPVCGEECAEGHVYTGRCTLAGAGCASPDGCPNLADCQYGCRWCADELTRMWEEDTRTAPDNPAVERASEPKEPGTAASDDTLRAQYAAAIWERQNPGRQWADCEYRWRADAEADADAVMAVRDTHLQQLRERNTYLEGYNERETARRQVWHARGETAEAALAAIRALADRYPVGIDAADLEAVLDGQDPAEDIDDWCDQPPTSAPASCSATLRMFETVIRCTDHRPGIHRGPLPNSASTHAWGDYAAGATPHNPDDTKEAGQ